MLMLYALVRNGEIVARFPTRIVAGEAFADVGC
jgi:hypothetical protein